MTPQQLVGTAVRLFAIWLTLSSIAYFNFIPTALGTSLVAQYGSFIVGALYLLVGALLWLFPMLIAHRIVPRTAHDNRLAVQGHELARAGIALLGLWLAAKALPSVVWILYRAFLFAEINSSFASLTADLKLDLAVSITELFIAGVLVAKAEALARLVVPACPTATIPPTPDPDQSAAPP